MDKITREGHRKFLVDSIESDKKFRDYQHEQFEFAKRVLATSINNLLNFYLRFPPAKDALIRIEQEP